MGGYHAGSIAADEAAAPAVYQSRRATSRRRPSPPPSTPPAWPANWKPTPGRVDYDSAPMADQRRAHPPASRAAATGAASSPEGRAEAVLPTAGAIVTATGDLDAALSERLRGLVRNIPDFPRPGVLFRDITTLLSDAQAFRATIEALAEPYRDRDVEVVVGIESRGFVLGGAIALTLGAGFVPVRKQGKLPYRTISVAYTLEYGEAVLEVHADAIAAGRRVLIVDDLLATGGTARATAELVERLGGQVVGLAFLIELSELGGSAALGDRPHTSLIRY